MTLKVVDVKLRFFTAEEGGKKLAITKKHYKSIFLYGNRNFECELWHDEEKLLPGSSIIAKILLLEPELVWNTLRIGADCSLWEGRIIAIGKIIGLGDIELT